MGAPNNLREVQKISFQYLNDNDKEIVSLLLEKSELTGRRKSVVKKIKELKDTLSKIDSDYEKVLNKLEDQYLRKRGKEEEDSKWKQHV